MEKRERAVCGTLCLCLAVAVLSAVALVYLTVIIYIPTQREMSAGINEIPVMCTTTERKVIKDDIVACRWSSCSEWCLSKGEVPVPTSMLGKFETSFLLTYEVTLTLI